MIGRSHREAKRAAYWRDGDQTVTVDTGIVEYGAMMIGPGRWGVLEVDGVRHGIVWTDDKGNLCVTGIEGMDTAGHRRALDATRAMAAAKILTTTAFEQMVQDYGVETIYSGLLEDLYAS
ncbi:hypothetical protein [Nocardia fluminea]|uniref:Uncharacterized protein n=1 Tax=Nocardia fluminea TaxID=134984 RepID=A0A2N3V558_9NOCA|nr:hypothetical protein [Nocardia fluminea]PKV76767.1 hypothetical protein ATK86_7170 [Nocardia fluminea]